MQAVAYLNTDVGECRQLQVPGIYSVGRASNSDFRPNTKSVSKNHALLELNVSPTTGKPEAWIEDFNSTFGTYVGVSPVAVEKISERTRLFFGLYIRFGHAPQCYQYLEHPGASTLGTEPSTAVGSVSNSSVQGDERSVTDTITSARRPRADRVPLRIVASPTNEEVTTQLGRRPTNDESPRSKVQDLVDRFEPSRTPLQSPEAKTVPKKGSSGNLSDTQIVMDMVTKIESTSPSHLAREPSFSFRSTPSPENSSKSHPAPSPSPSPANSFHSKRTESYKDFAEQKALRVDTTSVYQWIESLPGPTATAATASTAADCTDAVTTAQEAEASTPSASVSASSLGAAPLSSKDSSLSNKDGLFAPGKEADSGKELDYSIYDYDLDEKHGAGAQEVPSTAFRRNPSLWEDPALFDSLQQERESTSTRSMRTPPFNPMPSLQRNRSATPGSDVPQHELSAKSQGSTLSDRDRAIALLAQRNIAITQARQVFRERKLALLNPVLTAYPTYLSLAKQWERAVASVEAVDGGFCISIVLPFMRKVKIEACGRKKNKVRVEARRLVHQGDAVASDKSCEHICEYKLQGLSNEIQAVDLSHEYSAATGLLCVFVNRFKLQDPRLFVKERNLRGQANYVPQQPSRGAGMMKWLPLPGWMKEKKGRAERHNDQELRRALKESKESTADSTSASSSNSAPKATPRGSRSGASDAKPPRTPTSSSRAAAATGLGVTSPRAGASPPKRPSSSKLSGPKDASGVTSPRAVRADKPAAAAAPAVDRATLLRESIENGEVDGNVEFI